MKRSRGISALKCLKTKVFEDNAPASLIYRFLAKKLFSEQTPWYFWWPNGGRDVREYKKRNKRMLPLSSWLDIGQNFMAKKILLWAGCPPSTTSQCVSQRCY